MAIVTLQFGGSGRGPPLSSPSKRTVASGLQRPINPIQVNHFTIFFPLVLLDESLHVGTLFIHLLVLLLLEYEVLD